jgi:hypothetical protein
MIVGAMADSARGGERRRRGSTEEFQAARRGLKGLIAIGPAATPRIREQATIAAAAAATATLGIFQESLPEDQCTPGRR